MWRRVGGEDAPSVWDATPRRTHASLTWRRRCPEPLDSELGCVAPSTRSSFVRAADRVRDGRRAGPAQRACWLRQSWRRASGAAFALRARSCVLVGGYNGRAMLKWRRNLVSAWRRSPGAQWGGSGRRLGAPLTTRKASHPAGPSATRDRSEPPRKVRVGQLGGRPPDALEMSALKRFPGLLDSPKRPGHASLVG